MSSKQQARLEAARRKAGLKCAEKLDAAADALNAFMSACRECDDASNPVRNGAADSRIILVGNITEYSTYLMSLYGKDRPAAPGVDR